MWQNHMRASGKPTRGFRRKEVVPLDLSGGRHGILQQVLPIVCSSIKYNDKLILQYLNEGVRSLKCIYDNSHEKSLDDTCEVDSPQQQEQINLFNSTKSSHKSKVPQSYVQQNGSVHTIGNCTIWEGSNSFVYSNYLSQAECSSLFSQKNQKTRQFEEDLFTLEEYFCMLRCCLVHSSANIRAAGLRFIRYMLQSSSDAEAFFQANVVSLVVRCLDSTSSSSSSAERMQALRLVRKFTQLTAASKLNALSDSEGSKLERQETSDTPAFPASLVRCLVAIALPGLCPEERKERKVAPQLPPQRLFCSQCKKDKLYHSVLAVLTELVITHPEVSLSCGVASVLRKSLVETCWMPRVHEALLAALLRLANTPRQRRHTRHLLQVLAPYTDFRDRFAVHTIEHMPPSEESELVYSSARLCLLVLLRSWPGLLLITKNNLECLRAITAHLAHSPRHTVTRAIIDVLYEVFGIQESGGRTKEVCCDSHTGDTVTNIAGNDADRWEEMVAEHLATPTVSSEGWGIHEGFLAAEAKSSLPHLARCRPNLVQNHTALVLYVLIKSGLLGALCHVIVNSCLSLALRSTVLLGELLHRAHQDLPVECSQLIHALQELMNQAASDHRPEPIAETSLRDPADGRDVQKKRLLMQQEHLMSVQSSNPAINVSFLLADAAKRNSCESVVSDTWSNGNVREVPAAGQGPGPLPDSKSMSNLVSNLANYSFKSKLLLDNVLDFTDPFYIPTTSTVSNVASASFTQAQRKTRASLAVNALRRLANGRLNPPALPPKHSLYLAHLLHALPYAGSSTTSLGGNNICGPYSGGNVANGSALLLQQVYLRKKMVVTPANDVAKMSKWLGAGSELEEMVQRCLKMSQVLGEHVDRAKWNWDLIMAVLRWPSEGLQRMSSKDSNLFIHRLVHYFKPSADLFSKIDITEDSLATQKAEALMLLANFLLHVPEPDETAYLEELLIDLLEHLKQASSEKNWRPDLLLQPTSLSSTCSQYYFLLCGVLSRSSRGHSMLSTSGVLDQLLLLVRTATSTEVYVKLITSSLDYCINGINRTILSTALSAEESSERSRVYCTELLRALLRTPASPDTQRWLLKLLCKQLFDKSSQVCLSALSVLYEVTEVPDILDILVRSPVQLQPRLGAHRHLLEARMLQSSSAFNTLSSYGVVSGLLQLWDESFNVKYVQLQDVAVYESVTQHRRDESGQYGRRSNTPLTVHGVYVLPHLYGSLVQHREGLSVLLRHKHFIKLIETIKSGQTGSDCDVATLKAAIWAVCHAGSSSAGLSQLLLPHNALCAVVHIAASSSVYSVRGTCFMALSLVATTHSGVLALKELGWESVVRSHHQRWQSNSFPLIEPSPTPQLPRFPGLQLPQTCAQKPAKSDKGMNRLFASLNDDNYIGYTPSNVKPGFFVSDDSDNDQESGSGSCSDDDANCYLISGIGLDENVSSTRKCQTLPSKGRTPSQQGHQRSLSDCAPVGEESARPGDDSESVQETCECDHLGGACQHKPYAALAAPPADTEALAVKNSSRRGRLNTIFSSIKKKSERKRLDSTASSVSSTTSRLPQLRLTQHRPSLSSDRYGDSSPSPRVMDTSTPSPRVLDTPPPVTSKHDLDLFLQSPRDQPPSRPSCPFFVGVNDRTQSLLSPPLINGSKSWLSTPPSQRHPPPVAMPLRSCCCQICLRAHSWQPSLSIDQSVCQHCCPHGCSSSHDGLQDTLTPTTRPHSKSLSICSAQHSKTNYQSLPGNNCSRCELVMSNSCEAKVVLPPELSSLHQAPAVRRPCDLPTSIYSSPTAVIAATTTTLSPRSLQRQTSLPIKSMVCVPRRRCCSECHSTRAAAWCMNASLRAPSAVLSSSAESCGSHCPATFDVSSHESDHGYQVLLNFSEQRRACGEGRRQNYLSSLLSDNERFSKSRRLSGDTRLNRLPSVFPRNSSNSSLSYLSLSPQYVLAHPTGCCQLACSQDGHSHTCSQHHACESHRALSPAEVSKFTDAQNSCSLEPHITASDQLPVVPCSCHRPRSFSNTACYADAKHSISSRVSSGSIHSTGAPCSCSTCNSLRACVLHSESWRCCAYSAAPGSQFESASSNSTWRGPHYIGLTMPLNVNLLFDTTDHWNNFSETDCAGNQGKDEFGLAEVSDDNADEKSLEVPVSSDVASSLSENSLPPKAFKARDLVKLNSFASNEGEASVAYSSLTSCPTGSTVMTMASSSCSDYSTTVTCDTKSETGLLLHNKATCSGCFTLCQRRGIVQPVDHVATDHRPAAMLLAPGLSALLVGMPRSTIDDTSRPETPVEKWDDVASGITSSTGDKTGSLSNTTIVRVRKEVVRFVRNMINSRTAQGSENGLLRLKQHFPQAFRDVCLYSEVMQMISCYPYTVTTRRFLQEIFSDVPFKEIHEEADCLLRRLSTHKPLISNEICENGDDVSRACNKNLNTQLLQRGMEVKSSHGTVVPFEGFDNVICDDCNDANAEQYHLGSTENNVISFQLNHESIKQNVEQCFRLPLQQAKNVNDLPTGVRKLKYSSNEQKLCIREEKSPVADGGIMLLMPDMKAGDLTLSDYEGLSTSDEDESS